MSAKWKYQTYLVVFQESWRSTKRHRFDDWMVQFSDGRWEGWSQILENISNSGYEIINVVGIEDSAIGGSGGGTNAFRIFCKKPAD